MFYSDDPERDFLRHDREQQRKLDRRPRCWHCDEPIQQEDAVCIGGAWYCDHCLEHEFRKDIVD